MSAWRWNPGPELRLVFWIASLGAGSVAFTMFLQKERIEWSVVLGLVLVLIGYQLYRFLQKAQLEVKDFAEAVRYRDFSRNFNLKDAPADIRPLREGFNTINNTFRSIRREKETQYQYLQQILELVDIGILSYEVETGNQNWMNQAFRNMLEVPYLKNIHTLKLRDESLYEEIMAIRPGETRIVTVHTQQRNLKILIAGTLFQTDGVSNKLLAFQNINTALDETEARAWQRLLSVMTHEIMNSVAPISSLAATLKRMAAEPDLEETRADLELGLETIQRRSEGLLKFAETYRSLNKIVKPNLSEIYIRDLFESLLTLMEPSLEQKHISLEVILKEPRLTAWLDVNLVEQVLINLLVNASEAVRETELPRIVLSGTVRNQLLVIRIADNGSGIEPEILDKIFIPFFSTKKSGSGIGLSLCKQIMLLHKGNIQVFSKVGEGTAFELEFPVNGT